APARGPLSQARSRGLVARSAPPDDHVVVLAKRRVWPAANEGHVEAEDQAERAYDDQDQPHRRDVDRLPLVLDRVAEDRPDRDEEQGRSNSHTRMLLAARGSETRNAASAGASQQLADERCLVA